MGLGIFIPSVVVFAVVRYLTVSRPLQAGSATASALPKPEPTQDGPEPSSPYDPPGAAVHGDQQKAWQALRDSCRYLDLGSHIALTFPVWVAAAGIAQVLNGKELSPGICLMLAVGTIFLIVLCWESPTRQKMFHFAKELITARGIDPERLSDEAFVGLAVDCAPEAIGNCSETVGFISIADEDCTLHTFAADTVIPRKKATALTRVTPPGDTMGWVGVRAIGISWQESNAEETRTVYLLARYGETSFSMAAATDMLYERLREWAPDHVQTDA